MSRALFTKEIIDKSYYCPFSNICKYTKDYSMDEKNKIIEGYRYGRKSLSGLRQHCLDYKCKATPKGIDCFISGIFTAVGDDITYNSINFKTLGRIEINMEKLSSFLKKKLRKR